MSNRTSNIIHVANRIPRWPFTINRQSEQAQDLVVWLAMGSPGSGQLFDSQRNLSFSPTSTITTLGGLAPCVETLNTSAYFILGNSSDIIPTTQVTIAVRHRKTDASNRSSALFAVNATTNQLDRWCDALCPFNDGVIYWDFGGAEGDHRVTLSGQSFTEETWWAFTAGSLGMFIYRNGKAVANNGGVAVTRTASNDDFYFHGFPTVMGASADLCQVFDFRVYSRQFSVSEVWALYDPATRYELYQEQGRRTYSFLPGAAAAYTLTAATGSFTETGVAANLLYGRKVAADVGTFTETGVSANLLYGRKVAPAVGTFTETGVSASLLAGRKLATSAASFALAGQDIAFGRGYGFVAAPGSVVYSGQVASLLATRRLASAGGSFALSGQAAAFHYGFGMLGANGSFTETGMAANLLAARVLGAAAGSFTLTGQAASLVAGSTEIVPISRDTRVLRPMIR